MEGIASKIQMSYSFSQKNNHTVQETIKPSRNILTPGLDLQSDVLKMSERFLAKRF